MKPLIVVEGLDKEGKTTFSRRLAELLGLRYVHYPTTTECYHLTGNAKVDCFLLDMEKTIDLLGDGAVVDRYVVSTILYNDIPPAWEERVVSLLSRIDALIITPTADRLLRAKLSLMILNDMLKIPVVVSLIPRFVFELGGKTDLDETLMYFSSSFSRMWTLANLVGTNVNV